MAASIPVRALRFNQWREERESRSEEDASFTCNREDGAPILNRFHIVVFLCRPARFYLLGPIIPSPGAITPAQLP